MKSKFSFVSLFSGGMGLDLGIEEAGGELLLANEIDKGAVATIKRNRPDVPVIEQSITEVSGARILAEIGMKKGDLDLLCGGPPCQSFSVYGNREGALDPRGQLVFEFVRMVRELLPKTFIMENVRGLHSMPLVPPKSTEFVESFAPWMAKKGTLLSEIVNSLRDIGYYVDVFLVNSVNYGAPQIRERMLIIGNLFGAANKIAQPTHSNRPYEKLAAFKTLRDVIGEGFVDTIPELMDFSPRKKKYLTLVPPGGNWRSLPEDIQKESMGKSWYLKGGRSATWRKLSWDFPSPTVVTMPNHASTSMCHPDEVRALTVGECAAIQEFPKDWEFLGTTAEKYRQIGNAVPVRLGRIAGEAIYACLSEARSIPTNNTAIPKGAVDVVHLRPHVRTKRYWHKGEALAGDFSYYENDLPLFA
jgi:DNA (cytosine-5)-methyltransferase 1